MRERNRKTIGVVLVLLAIYLPAFPRGTGQELRVITQWVSDVGAATTGRSAVGDPAAGTPRAFRLGQRFGYLDQHGAVLLSEEVLYNVALTDQRFANYSEVSQTVVIHDQGGGIIGTIDAEGYPFFFGNRTLLMHPDGATVSEWRSDGAMVWRHSMPAILSAIDAAGDVTLIGAIDGRLAAIDRSGGDLLQYRSRSGRLALVTAVALSSDAGLAAAVLDIDPQRVLLFRRGEEGYSAAAEFVLEESLRRPVRMAFAFADRMLIWEQSNALGGIRIDSQARFTLPLPGRLSDFADIAALDLLAVVVADDNPELLLLHPPQQAPVLRLPLRGGEYFLRADGQNLLLGIDERIVSFSLEQG